jgi:hypothetical protein
MFCRAFYVERNVEQGCGTATLSGSCNCDPFVKSHKEDPNRDCIKDIVMIIRLFELSGDGYELLLSSSNVQT